MEKTEFEFGEFKLDFDQNLLVKNGKRVPMRPQALKVLSHLAQNKGKVISKEELGKILWNQINVDEAQSINVLIRVIRTTLGDNPKDPSIIETIPRRGYRFIGKNLKEEQESKKYPQKFKELIPLFSIVSFFLLVFFIYQVVSQDSKNPSGINDLSSQARNQFFKGMMHYEKGNIEESLQAFREVTVAQPDFAEGYFWLASTLERGNPVNRKFANLIRPYLVKALALSPDYPEALVKMGYVYLIGDFDAIKAASLAKKANSLNPDYPEALNLLTLSSLALGDVSEAIKNIKRVSDMDPDRAHIGTEGWVYFMAGDYEAAARTCRLSIQAGFVSENERNCLFESYLAMGEDEMAIQQAVEIMKISGMKKSEIAKIVNGEPEKALIKYYQWRAKYLENMEYDFYERAILDLRLGNPVAALVKLNTIVNEGRFPPIVLIPTDPRLNTLRSYPDADTVFNIFK